MGRSCLQVRTVSQSELSTGYDRRYVDDAGGSSDELKRPIITQLSTWFSGQPPSSFYLSAEKSRGRNEAVTNVDSLGL